MYKRSTPFYEFGPFRLDPSRRLLFRQDEVIPLTPKVLHTGEHQIWKVRPDGSEPTQITKLGGSGAAFESVNGKFVYYAKNIGASTGAATLWRTPVGGGEEVKILDSVFRLQFAVARSGIYIAAPADGGSSHASSIRFLSFRTGKVTTIAPREWAGQPGVSVSPDGRFLLYSFAELIASDLMLAENFR